MEMEESKKELQGIKENFCTISVKDEEVSSCCFLLNILLVIALCSSASHFAEFFSYLPNICSLIFPRLENTGIISGFLILGCWFWESPL